MKDERMRVIRVSLILALSCAVVSVAAVAVLYQVHLTEMRQLLTVIARSDAELIGAVARHQLETQDWLTDEDPYFDPRTSTLSIVEEASLQYSGFGRSGELVLGYLHDDTTLALLLHRDLNQNSPELVVPGRDPIAEPMRRALAKQSGTMIGKDYGSKTVMAAYEPVADIEMGVVAKVDLAEVRDPYIEAGLVAGFIALFVTILGVILIRRESEPIVRRLRADSQALKAGRDELALAHKIAGLAGWTYDIRSDRLTQADELFRLLGVERSSYPAAPSFACIESLTHPDDVMLLRDYKARAEQSREPVSLDFRMVCPDGSTRYMRAYAQLTSGSQGEPCVLSGTFQDITVRKRTEIELEHRESMFRSVTESARDAIIAIDTVGHITVFNAAAEAMFGVSAHDMLGGSLDAIIPDSFREIHTCRMDALLNSGQSSGAVGNTLEGRGRRQDGEEFPVELSLSACDNVPSMRVVAIIRDITIRRRAEQFEQVLSRISAASNLHSTMSDLLQYCHRRIAEVMNAANFYVVLYHRDTSQYSFPYAMDHYIDVGDLPVARMDRSMADYVRRTGLPLLADEAEQRRLVESGEVELIGEWSRIWMGVPLETPDGVVGVMVLQSYDDENAYGGRELSLARGIAERIAPAVARMQAEVALGESEAKYRILVENQSDLVVRLGVGGSFLYVSPSYCELFGKTENELLGNAFLPYVHPEERAVTAKSLKDLLRPPHSCALEHRARTKYGWRWISWSLKAVIDANGKVTAIVGVGRDITERRAAEETYRRLATAVQQASDTILITNREGIIEYVNPAFERTSGYMRDEAVGQTPRILKSGNQNEEFYASLWRTISAGLVWKGRLVNRRKDGSLYQEVAIISPVRDEQGNIINYVAVKRDITQEVELERQLNQAQKLEAVGSLAAGIAHEINTPIQFVGDNVRFLSDSFRDLLELAENVSAAAEAISSGSEGGDMIGALRAAIEKADIPYLRDEIPRAVEQTLDGVDRVATIVRAMKDFSHPEQKDKSNTDLNRAIQSTLIVARNELKYVADVVTDFDESLPPVFCYPSDLNQVFLNLLVNAAHAIADVVGIDGSGKGTITVSTRRDGNNVVVAISDTGTGIPEKVRDRVFEHFFTTKEVGKGTGQGLSIARSVVVEKHGGELTFETEAGKGTTFYIRLPMGEEILETVA